MDKNSRRIRAVIDNDVVALRELCDATDWCNYVEPETGNTFLHLALHACCSEEVFRYLLSFDRIPLSHKNNDGLSALEICLAHWSPVHDVFACELIKRGASLDNLIFPTSDDKLTLLHYAIQEPFVEVSKLLIQMGHDLNALNALGRTPIWVCLDSGRGHTVETELVAALLCFGADPWQGRWSFHYIYNAFEYSVRFYSHAMQETLFYFMIDEYTVMDVHIEILLTLAHERSPFFLDTVKHVRDVTVGNSAPKYYTHLFTINDGDLAALIQKCPDAIRQVLSRAHQTRDHSRMFDSCEKMSLQNANLLLESDDLRDATIEFISSYLNHNFYFHFLLGLGSDESIVIENVSFLLSYGLTLNGFDLKEFYERYGFGKLLKMLFYMDVERPVQYTGDPLLLLLFDVSCDLQKILHDENMAYRENFGALLPYFAHAEVRALSRNDARPEVVAAIARQPNVPLLLELARNVFRGHFVKTFAINSAKQFYVLIDKLPISQVYKRIITLEKKLY